MSALPKAIPGVLLGAALALSSCGGDAPAKKASVFPTVSFTSPSIGGTELPAAYTCNGKDIFPPLEWGTVPADVKSVALFVVGFIPEPSTKSYKVSVEWAVAGVNPALHRLLPGRLPPGVILGRTDAKSTSYSICPKRGTPVHYQFELYGVPAADRVKPDFEGFKVLTALADPKVATHAVAHGAFVENYTRQ